MIESQYTTNINKRLPAGIYSWKINDNFAGGVPDAFYRSLGGTGKPVWVEYKFLKSLPKRESTLIKPNLSTQQLLWLEMAIKAGEQAIVIVGVESEKIGRQVGGFIVHPTEWRVGITASEAKSRLQSYDQVGEFIHSITI